MQYKIKPVKNSKKPEFKYINFQPTIIRSVQWSNCGNEISWVTLETTNISDEVNKQLTSHPGAILENSEFKGMFRIEGSENRNSLIALFQEIDPLPLIFFEALNNIGIEIPDYLIDLEKMASEKIVEEIIVELLKVSEQCPDKFIELVNFYQNNNKPDEYIKALEAIPENNPFFIEANISLLEFYNSTNNDSIESLTKKFKAAYNAQLHEAELYFSELSGERGISHLVPMKFGSDADFIISLALIIREKNKKIISLEVDPDKSTANKLSFF